MTKIRVDISNALQFLATGAAGSIQPAVDTAQAMTAGGTGKGSDFLGWVRLPSELTPALLERVEKEAQRLRKIAEVVVVIGIGGSYLGSRAVIEALSHPFLQLMEKREWPLVLFAGENLSEDYHAGLMDILDKRNYAVIVISKSGTTTEPAVAFRIIRAHLENKYGRKGAAERIVAVTDAARGALKGIADKEGYPSYVIPDDVGGRYSVLTPVGLLPVAAAGFDIKELVEGARDMEKTCLAGSNPDENPAAMYAAIRNLLYLSGKTTEIMVTYQPNLVFFTEWWKQLYGESEGKEGKGIFPAGVNFTADLHSMGQFIQEGTRNLFETVLSVEAPERRLEIPSDPANSDGLNFLAGKRYSEVNAMAELGTRIAHVEGGVPNIRITIPALNAYTLGQLIYFYEYACALSGYTLGVNPFDQPGVEAYKKNMFALLGKPGFEELREKLMASVREG
jgi:glucose-6-phosphate isomerase